MVKPTSVPENDFSPGDQSDQLDRGVAIAADPMALHDLQRRPVGSTDDPERDREFLALMRRPFFAFVEHRASLGDVPELCDLGRQFLEFPVDFFGFRMGLVSRPKHVSLFLHLYPSARRENPQTLPFQGPKHGRSFLCLSCGLVYSQED